MVLCTPTATPGDRPTSKRQCARQSDNAQGSVCKCIDLRLALAFVDTVPTVRGTITVGVASSDEEARFAVADNGAGMPADQLEVVFERFRQPSRDRRGLGLGLYISKSIVEAHGGRILVKSALGTGSTFYFTIPNSAASPSVAA